MSDNLAYGIVANIIRTDGHFRTGAKCWITGGAGGQGYDRFVWYGKSRGGRDIFKWAPTHLFQNFRAAWIPPHMSGGQYPEWGRHVGYMLGPRRLVEKRAAELEAFAELERQRRAANAPLTANS